MIIFIEQCGHCHQFKLATPTDGYDWTAWGASGTDGSKNCLCGWEEASDYDFHTFEGRLDYSLEEHKDIWGALANK